ncbi:L,D-transpeptidase catalytic domain [Enhygromyxa salina]|uniref:L,D-transpeptidase catalytic domain n=1 Tax=Enhygromyxa salina TaxID=215803 RepID=A0A2S9XWA2_9BACT|nr:L,D-transpeptidase [Enhygromyxa salina]PRP97122.1 L,D-transpeptidase catalytic domain [Enhygromyxa salina]
MMPITATLLAHTLRVLTGLEPGPSADEVEIEPTDVRYIEATWSETVVRGRPWVPHKRLATVSDGTRLVVRGIVQSRDDKGCHGKPWYAIYPFGFVCSEQARESERGPEPGAAMPLAEGRRVPFSYAYVRTDGVPMYAGYADVDAGVPTRPLTKGMSLVVARTLEYDGADWIQTEDGALVPKAGIRFGGQGSEWSGVELTGTYAGPSFAWTKLKKGTPVRSAPATSAERVLELELRTRVPLLERSEASSQRSFWRVGEDLWIDADHLNEVHIAAAPPPEVLDDWRGRNTGNDQWIDVDLGEQVLVGYRGDRAVFATMVSSGRSMPTPRGNYPVWAKVASTTMASQAYEDKPYMVQGVPWVILFQGHNALHGAYWHDKFGTPKSHGCVNLAPHDARYVFEWTGPTLPLGWTGYLPSDLRRAVVVHVRDSSRGGFVQDRPIGPPDREAEKARAEAADERRALSEYDSTPQYDPAFVPGGVVVDPSEVSAELPDPGETPSGPRLEPRTSPGIGAGLPG